jgi:pyruvate dehydrogenase E2 component (dihydrolipoamide acetyltransferase)
LVKEGQDAKIGQAVATLVSSGDAAAPAPKAPPESSSAPVQPQRREETAQGRVTENSGRATQAAPNRTPLPAGIPVAASPSVRKMAEDLGINLSRVQGTGNGGRIQLEDVRAYIQYLQSRADSTNGTATHEAPKAAAAPTMPLPDFSKWGSVKREKVSTLRRTIAERMVESWTTIPHVTQHYETDITALNILRKKHAPAFEKKGARLTVTSFTVKILAALLKKHPIFNASYDTAAREIVYKDYVSIGIAVETEAGLMVPVLRDADKKDLVQISKDIQALAEKARTRKLSMEEMHGGTFTISNQGAIGGAFFTPIINLPEVAILGMGQGALAPVYNKDGKLEQRMKLPLSLSHDHRVIDGAAAARFIKELSTAFETFSAAQLGVKA